MGIKVLFWTLVGLWCVFAVLWIVSISIRKFRERNIPTYLIIVVNALAVIICVINLCK